ncbi:MAG TPA: EexN family lipoprotein [Acetobacteraceae bacterium]|nr:EexN family lipoprotein [Acetobacteraceae bacterium]
MTIVSRPLLIVTAIGLSSAAGLAVIVYSVVPGRPPVANWVTPPPRMMPRPPEPHTVTWFKAHVPELQAKLAACKDNPGEGRTDAECDNAQHAQWDRSFDAFLGKSK